MTSSTLEDRLQSTGAVLRDRVSIVDRIMATIRQKVAEQPADTNMVKQPSRE